MRCAPALLLLLLLAGCGRGSADASAEVACPEARPRVGSPCSGERICTYLVSSRWEQLLERVGLRTDAGCAQVLSCSALGTWQSRGAMHCY